MKKKRKLLGQVVSVETGLWMSGLLLTGGALLTGIGTFFGFKKAKEKEGHR